MTLKAAWDKVLDLKPGYTVVRTAFQPVAQLGRLTSLSEQLYHLGMELWSLGGVADVGHPLQELRSVLFLWMGIQEVTACSLMHGFHFLLL